MDHVESVLFGLVVGKGVVAQMVGVVASSVLVFVFEDAGVEGCCGGGGVEVDGGLGVVDFDGVVGGG